MDLKITDGMDLLELLTQIQDQMPDQFIALMNSEEIKFMDVDLLKTKTLTADPEEDMAFICEDNHYYIFSQKLWEQLMVKIVAVEEFITPGIESNSDPDPAG